MKVSQILGDKSADVISIAQDNSIGEVVKLLSERRIGAIPVMKGEKLMGIISERDIVRGIAIRGGEVLEDSVGTLMTTSVITCTPNDTVEQLMIMMTERRIRHLPVLNEDKMVGMMSIGDLVKVRLQETEQEAEALKEYIAHA